MTLFIDALIIVVLILGIRQFRRPRSARVGNFMAAFALLSALILVVFRSGLADVGTVVAALLFGAVIGYWVAETVSMVQIPAMVAFQHGAGGVAAFLVSFVELTRDAHALDLVSEVSGVLGLTIGALTFSGSIVASAKLANKLRQTAHEWPAHQALVFLNLGGLLAVGVACLYAPAPFVGPLCVVQIVLAAAFGIVFSVRIGGADMPVLISFLNATAGLAASLCGMVIGNRLLIAFGATVAASGSILTHVMCKAMNRSMMNVIWPSHKFSGEATQEKRAASVAAAKTVPRETPEEKPENSLAAAVDVIRRARSVIIIPGYGMALAKAQQTVAALAGEMRSRGAQVKYAIHPVAGRMPGHMNVILAEAEVDYDDLLEMDDANPLFPDTDVALVVGACDVVNPAAIEIEGTPISGMPILMAHLARHVICCNVDEKPGYSGVENPLYHKVNTILLPGDAGGSVQKLLAGLANAESGFSADSAPSAGKADAADRAAKALADACKVIVVPGYGMALAKAQFGVAELAEHLRRKGVSVKFAIHPVAGRMPGHMNVILAEAEVDYDDLLEMDDANPLFPGTDVVLVVGACDVVNPAAIEIDGTPISGMPILMAHQATTVIVCNVDTEPGYSGVPNPLYDRANTILLLGDARESVTTLMSRMALLEP